VSEHLCQGDWGGNFSKEILHFDKSGLGFLDFLFCFSAKERGAHVRAAEEGRTCEIRTVHTCKPYSLTV
jgi:hypothetical protein